MSDYDAYTTIDEELSRREFEIDFLRNEGKLIMSVCSAMMDAVHNELRDPTPEETAAAGGYLADVDDLDARIKRLECEVDAVWDTMTEDDVRDTAKKLWRRLNRVRSAVR